MGIEQTIREFEQDAKTAEDAVSTNSIVTPRIGNPFKALPLIAQEAEQQANLAIEKVIENGMVRGFATEVLLKAWTPDFNGARAKADDTKKTWRWELTSSAGVTPITGNWVDTGLDSASQVLKEVFSAPSKNLFDKSKTVRGSYFSAALVKIVSSTLWRRSDFIPVIEGKAYTLSGNLSANNNIAWFATDDSTSTAISFTTSKVGQVAPAGAKFAVFNLTNTGQDDTTYDSTTQLEQSLIVTDYESYQPKIAKENVAGLGDLEEEINEKLSSSDVLEYKSHNLINPPACDYVRRYSTASKGFSTDTLGIAATAYIPVSEGEWYVISGEYYGNTTTPQGGYFASTASTTALENITWSKPVDNIGHCFQVPLGSAITHIVINLKKSAVGATTLLGNVQLEKGEQATTYQPYLEKAQIKSALLPGSSGGSSGLAAFNDAAWYKYIAVDGAKIHQDKLPKFRKAMLLKSEDVVVVNTGTSLTARTSEHCTDHADAAFRPPMMHSNAFCSHIWDSLKWDGQQYRRYDSAYFTETGTFATASNLTEWDDGAYRAGLTRYSSSENAAVQFQIPVNAWQFNFIYRTDSVGCSAKVVVAEGVGKVQVFDEATQAWVEAHNYEFSQLEAAPVNRSVNIPNPVTGALTATILASKGNTTYQKRLKMRCRSGDGTFNTLTTAKSVTIARVSGGARFMYWGVEWSPRQYMITYINSARGSHQTSATNERGLPRYQDNEIWSFKPTLILSELGIHNDGAGGAGAYPVGTFAGLTYNYVNNTDFELSMFSRAAHFNLELEYCFFTASIAYNFNGIEEDGSLKFGLQTASIKGAARMMTALDKTQEAIEYLNSVDIAAIDATKRWCDAGFAIFGDLKTATIGSGKAGETFTNEGSHWNDTGSAIMAKIVSSVI